MGTTMAKVIKTDDAIEVTDGSEDPSTRTKIIWSVVGITIVTLLLGVIFFMLPFAYAAVLWTIWKPYQSTSYLFDRKTLKVYRVLTKKKQRHLKELAHFSELGKFRIIEVEERESSGSTDTGSIGSSD
jgi:hypothetical protein